jgi:hypothetical protein
MKFVSTLLKQHLQRYPQMQLADIYKLLHQAALGNGHAVRDEAAVHAALREEIATMGSGPDEPLTDPISPDGTLARIHLRAYAAAGHDIDALAHAFAATAQQRPPERDKLERFCACLGDFAATGGGTTPSFAPGEIAFDAARVRAYFAQIVESGYPVVHHSDAFRSAYRPAYRVVQIDLLSL